jgi:hypothetical protein
MTKPNSVEITLSSVAANRLETDAKLYGISPQTLLEHLILDNKRLITPTKAVALRLLEHAGGDKSKALELYREELKVIFPGFSVSAAGAKHQGGLRLKLFNKYMSVKATIHNQKDRQPF